MATVAPIACSTGVADSERQPKVITVEVLQSASARRVLLALRFVRRGPFVEERVVEADAEHQQQRHQVEDADALARGNQQRHREQQCRAAGRGNAARRA